MGALRFILAMSVAYGHAGDFLGFPLIPGDTAVQCFYAVSGFYMALILNEKYRPELSSYFLFISNRFARLFPAYAAVLCLTLLFAAVSSAELPFVSRWHSLPALDWWSAVFLIGSQILMWGQDLYFYLTLKAGALTFWPDFHTAPEPIIPLLVIPQGWTLGLEFSFYLIAPFIVRRSAAAIVSVLAASSCVAPSPAACRLFRRSVVLPLLPLGARGIFAGCPRLPPLLQRPSLGSSAASLGNGGYSLRTRNRPCGVASIPISHASSC